MRDDFAKETKLTIAQRVAWRCSRPACRAVTAGPHTNDAKALNVGVAAHITAASPDGPRYDVSLTTTARKAPTNAVWLCQSCAKLVDNDPQQFDVTTLRDWKDRAEAATTIEVAKTAQSLPENHDEIWRLFKKYAPDASAEVLFRQAYDTLSAADPELKYEVSLDGNRISMSVVRRDGEPVNVSFSPTFLDTDRGREKALEFQRFLDEGTAVELDETCIPIEDLPDPIRRAIRDRPKFLLRLGPRRPRHFAIAFIFRNEAGDIYEFPYIDLASNRFEGDAVVLSNEQQRQIPFRFEEWLYPDRRAETSFGFYGDGRSFWWLRELLRFQAVLAHPCETVIRDLDDGIEHAAAITNMRFPYVAIDAEVVERVVAVQQRTKSAINMPARDFFTAEDLHQLESIEHILATGKPLEPPAGVLIGAPGVDGATFLSNVQQGGHVAWSVPMHIEDLMGNQVRLGPVEYFCGRMRVAAEDEARLTAYLAAEVPAADNSGSYPSTEQR
jgi:hypothetical protein